MAEQLKERAMLVTLNVTSWHDSVTDREVSDDIATQHQAQDGAGRYVKQLLSRESTFKLRKAAGEARRVHFELTLPWDRGKYRLLPIKMYEKYKKSMDRYQELRIDARNEFIAKYDDHITEASTRLGTMFDRDLYPSEAEIIARTGMEYAFAPVPDAENFRASATVIGSEEVRLEIETAIKSSIDEEVAIRTQFAVQDVVERFEGQVRELMSKIGIEAVPRPAEEAPVDSTDAVMLKGKRFQDAALDSMRDFFETLPALNIMGDPHLDALAETGTEVLADVQPNELRPNHKDFSQEKHDKVMTAMEDMAGKLAGYFG